MKTSAASPLCRGAWAILCGLTLALPACGGGGAGGDDGTPALAGTSGTGASGAYANKCAPDNGLARNDRGDLSLAYTGGTLNDEKSWVRSYMNEAYLWYREIPGVDATLPDYNLSPAQVALDNWFEALKSPVLTPANRRKDSFSFTLPTAQWNALAQTGAVGGYGIEWAIASTTAPRNARVAYVEANSPAAAAGLARGDTMLALTIGGVTIDFVNTTLAAEIDLLNQSMFTPLPGTQATFRLRGNDGVERDAAVTATQVLMTPVKQASILDAGGGGKVGYLLLNDFILPGEAQIKTAMEGFQAAAVSDLILDLRYNGGGYLFIASQLAYMIAPPAATAGKTFERSLFSDKRDAASSRASSNLAFLPVSSGTRGSGTVANAPLPNLGLNRVYVLTTSGTCSASESVINGLRGVDVEVIVLGASTCGKPYGFTARDNCGLSYFPVEFQGVNQKGFGDFADGFVPACTVDDDLGQPLGSESEGLLAAALAFRSGASCAAIASGGIGEKEAGAGRTVPVGTVVRPPARANKFLER